ncbi:SDR family NAD(P)-dependent oxidoreductase [Streptomyces massasporeus]|uniref:SDR family NAD(P)-dependent oxidoreductase n=1 Tax=Streptomyces massasporeus TaxID=67324 RepID=A0ABW6LEN2_9ACTN
MTGRLSERVAIVTGGAGGIGSAVARALSAEGTSVVIADIRDAEGTDLAAGLGGRSRFQQLDVAGEDDRQRAVTDTERDLGPVSVGWPASRGSWIGARWRSRAPASFRRVVVRLGDAPDDASLGTGLEHLPEALGRRGVRARPVGQVSCRTDSTFPAGSVNQAISGPPPRKMPLSSVLRWS